MRIALADTHGLILEKGQICPNLGLLYLASYLKEKKPETEFIYIPQRFSFEDHIKKVLDFKLSVPLYVLCQPSVPFQYGAVSQALT